MGISHMQHKTFDYPNSSELTYFYSNVYIFEQFLGIFRYDMFDMIFFIFKKNITFMAFISDAAKWLIEIEKTCKPITHRNTI